MRRYRSRDHSTEGHSTSEALVSYRIVSYIPTICHFQFYGTRSLSLSAFEMLWPLPHALTNTCRCRIAIQPEKKQKVT